MAKKSIAARVAGMDGNHTDKVVAYLSRLTGNSISANERIFLRSVHRASLALWLRKEQIAFQGMLVGSARAGFTVSELLHGEPAGAPLAVLASANAPAFSVVGAGAIMGIGLDIEEVDSLPKVQDYRENPFFSDTFTASEISYCIRQPNERASFCGIWAAKEAILKSGLTSLNLEELRSIEITWDDQGRPLYPGSVLSISHTRSTAVAVCVAIGLTALASSVTEPSSVTENDPIRPAAQMGVRAVWKLPSIFAGLIIIGVIIFSLVRQL